ncbi:MAG TPA: hypothetical protein PLF01_01480 [Alphaproteobacteria bacterium]|nr:hypothetical protein [Alphaproteobacteria bacterium]
MPRNQDDLLIGGFGQLPQNVDATGRIIRDKNPPLPTRKPETISPTAKGNALLDFIGKLESSDNYNVLVGGEKASLTKMTVKEVQELQRERKKKRLGTPAGRYQIKDEKLNDLVRWMGINENEIFDEKLQDQMGRELLRRRGFEKFKSGEINTKEFIRHLAKEWAALPKDETNESHHKGKSNNKALTTFEKLRELLEKD